jgi:hypothetical protein
MYFISEPAIKITFEGRTGQLTRKPLRNRCAS